MKEPIYSITTLDLATILRRQLVPLEAKGCSNEFLRRVQSILHEAQSERFLRSKLSIPALVAR